METPIGEPANTISASSEVLCWWLREANHAQPSFKEDSPPAFPQADAPQAVRDARERLVSATSQLNFLAQWPVGAAQSFANTHAFDAASLRCLVHLNIAEHVPLQGSIGFSNLATRVDTDEERLTRILRYAMTNHWFLEPEQGKVSHSAMSSLLVKNKAVLAQVSYQSQVGVPSSAAWIESMQASRYDGAYTNSPFNLAFKTEKQSMAWAAEDPIKSVWFDEMMRAYQQSSQFALHHTVVGYDWAALGDGLLVDVGGNTGTTASAIAAVAPRLRFIVLDRHGPVSKGKAELDDRFRDRIQFQEHDFFEDNPVVDADAFLVRSVLHDWPDQDAVRILRKLISAMKPKAKLFIVDSVVPPPGAISASMEKTIRLLDMIMFTMMNSKERTVDDWKELLQRTGTSAQIIGIHTPPGSALSIIEVAKAS